MLKAITTRYAGCAFRSRLEARWAVFFDCLGLSWEYEREGYELPRGPYLPDFWLPQAERFVEIKGQPPTKQELELCGELAAASKLPVVVFHGLPGEHTGRQCDPLWGGVARVWLPVTIDLVFGGLIERAAAAAKSARFEFGEGPRFQVFKRLNRCCLKSLKMARQKRRAAVRRLAMVPPARRAARARITRASITTAESI